MRAGVFRCQGCDHLFETNTRSKKALIACPKCHKRRASLVAHTHVMDAYNGYGRQLSTQEIEAGVHRDFIGQGVWEKGPMLTEFLKHQGLNRNHKILDLGCGALRVGISLIEHVSTRNYFGMDCNASLLSAARHEAHKAGLDPSELNLAESSRFEVSTFGQRFDYALAVSVFTHLPMHQVILALKKLSIVLDGPFYATFFKAPESAAIDSITHREPQRTSIGLGEEFETYYDADPYHYSTEELQWMASITGLRGEEIDAELLPLDPVIFLHCQTMMRFTRL